MRVAIGCMVAGVAIVAGNIVATATDIYWTSISVSLHVSGFALCFWGILSYLGRNIKRSN